MNMFRKICWIAAIAMFVGGCATIEKYSLVSHGTRQVGNVSVSVNGAWNKVPDYMLAYTRDDSEVWTREGILLDRFIVIPDVPDGEPIFVQKKESTALPVFRAGMLPHELAELTESSIVKLLGEGNTVVTTDNLRPHRFGDDRGVVFEFTAITADGPRYRGLVGTITSGDRLTVLMYLAVSPHYFDRTLADATRQIESARLTAG